MIYENRATNLVSNPSLLNNAPMVEETQPARRGQNVAQAHGEESLSRRTRVRLAAMAGHMKQDAVAARRVALADLLADGRPHRREEIWTAVEAQIGQGCWGARPEETLWRDLKTLRDGGLRIAYSRRPEVEGYYLQDPVIKQRAHPHQAPNEMHVAGIRRMTVPEKNRQAFAAAEFALRQKRLLLAREHPDWTTGQIDAEARRQVYGRHGVP